LIVVTSAGGIPWDPAPCCCDWPQAVRTSVNETRVIARRRGEVGMARLREVFAQTQAVVAGLAALLLAKGL
jgi:hypothetical protein